MNATYATAEDIYKKVVLVIGSCVTIEQLTIAKRYVKLFSKRLAPIDRKYYEAAIIMWLIQKRKIRKNVIDNETKNADKTRDGVIDEV
jgi:hypothetical protein